MSGINSEAYYSYSLAAAAEELGTNPEDVRSLVQRGALDGHFSKTQWRVHLGRRPGQPKMVRLWHGTSRDRADLVLANGFETLTYGHQVWMTSKEKQARSHAIDRAERRHSEPVVLCCAVDLDQYRFFTNPSQALFVFYQALGKEVVTQVDGVDPREKSRRFRMEQKRQNRQGSVGVVVTSHAGPLGVLLWINAYRQLQGLPELGAEDLAVVQVVDWVKQEYDGGRQTPLGDDELVAVLEAALP